jgi:hypothetical protein
MYIISISLTKVSCSTCIRVVKQQPDEDREPRLGKNTIQVVMLTVTKLSSSAFRESGLYI